MAEGACSCMSFDLILSNAPHMHTAGVSLTYSEFNRAITACGFRSQPDSKRVHMLQSIAKVTNSSSTSICLGIS